LTWNRVWTRRRWEEKMKRVLQGLAFAISVLGSSHCVDAKLIKFEVLRTESPAFEGRTFPPVGTYDRIIARATIAVPPDDPHNSVIVDIDHAPRNAHGLVEAVSDVEILRPTIATNANRRLFYEVVNRGNKLGLALFNDTGLVNDLAKAADAGNGFLMSRGYTIVWSGWQGDTAAVGGRLTFSPPIVPQVTGLSREEFVFDHLENPAVATLSYPASDLDPAQVKLTVRERESDPRSAPNDLSMKFEDSKRVAISRPAGFDAGAIYEIIYLAKDPKVMGVGFAATRDVVSFLRYEKTDEEGTPNLLAGQVDRAIAFGASLRLVGWYSGKSKRMKKRIK